MSDALLGLDIGTTSTKATLFDLSGAELATAEEAYELHTPRPGWVEQDPEALWQATLAALRTVTEQAKISSGAHRVSLALAAQSGSLLPARLDGTPVGSIITWMDGRTEALVKRWKAQGLEDRVRAIGGWHLYPGLCLPTIAWLRENQPDTFAAAKRFLSVNDFLVYRLTGRFCTNPSNAGGMQLLDVARGEWSPELCDLAGIKTGMLSSIVPAGTVVGPLSAEVSGVTGLPADTLVVNGGHDQGCTALGLGVTEPGKVLLGCGTAWVVTGVTDNPDITSLPPSLDMNFHTLPHAPQPWTVSQSLGGLGASVEWLLRQCWRGTDDSSLAARSDAFAALDRELQETQPGGEGLVFVPLSGRHGAPAGDHRGSVLGLRLDHTRADMVRAVMEGAAYELRWALDPIRKAGLPVEQMWMIGGAASSPLWPTIVADVTGVPLILPKGTHGPATGAAILAGVGSGVFGSMEAGLERFQRRAQQIVPDLTTSAIYDESFSAYQEIASQVVDGD